MCHNTTKVHLPNTAALACPSCSLLARTFTYRRTKERELLPLPEGETLETYSPPARKIASVRSWQWKCDNCGHVVLVTNRIPLDAQGNRGEIEETVTTSNPDLDTNYFVPTVDELAAENDKLQQDVMDFVRPMGAQG